MTESQHGFEGLDARQVGQERDRGLDVHIGVVVVGIDVGGGFEADDVRSAVRVVPPQGLVRTVLVLVAAILHAEREPQFTRGQRDRGASGRNSAIICRTSASTPASTAMYPRIRQDGVEAEGVESSADGDAAIRRECQFLDLRPADIAGPVLLLAACTVLRVDVEVPVARQAAARPGHNWYMS